MLLFQIDKGERSNSRCQPRVSTYRPAQGKAQYTIRCIEVLLSTRRPKGLSKAPVAESRSRFCVAYLHSFLLQPISECSCPFLWT